MKAATRRKLMTSTDSTETQTRRDVQLTAHGLRCEYHENPLGIDIASPRLTWALSSARRGARQTAFQILAASTLEKLAAGVADLWDSGQVRSDEPAAIYAGKPLTSGREVHWKLRVWDDQDLPSDYSQPARWEMGLMEAGEWQASWIGKAGAAPASEEEFYRDDPAPLLRREFAIDRPIARARAYVSGLGYYEFSLNGQRVGKHLLDPGWTTYSQRVPYSAYDVTALLQQGANAAGMILGNGWYNPLPLRMWYTYNLREFLTIGRPRGLLRLVIDYEDGTSQAIVTDTSWKVGHSPILRNNVYLGEVYDARNEQRGWDKAGFDDSEWQTPAVIDDPIGPLRWQEAPPIRHTRTLKPVALTEPAPGVYLFDFGQNFAGWIRLRPSAARGTRITLRYGELLYPDGTLNGMTSVAGQVKRGGKDYRYDGVGVPQTAFQSDVYVCSGKSRESYTQRFTFRGFRYAEVSGLPNPPSLDLLQGLRLNSDVKPAGSFSCSNEMFNRIDEVIRWTQLSNLFSVQSDCPHREKFGYGGDIVASSETFLLNFDMASFYTKAVHDFAEAACPDGGITETAPFVGNNTDGLGGNAGPVGWGTAYPLLQWQLYQYYGERRLFEEQYEASRRWVELLRSKADGHILINGISDHESLVPKPQALTGTAFYYYNTLLLSRIAKLIGRAADAEQYAALAEQIRAAFNRRFLDQSSGRYDTGTQACQAFALYMGLVPEEQKQAALNVLLADIREQHKGHVSTGIFGTKYMLQVLSDMGRADVACELANQKSFPGWGHMLENGATTLWETWAFSDNIYSHNHPMFAPIGEWFVKHLAGIQPAEDAVGFDKIIMRPQIVRDLTWAKAEYQSVRGRIRSGWKLNGNRLTLEIEIPPGCSAIVHVPADDSKGVKESRRAASAAEGVRARPAELQRAVFEVSSGRYRFTSALSRRNETAARK